MPVSLPTMLFVRTYHKLLGGHLKVFDYISHTLASGMFEPVLFLTPESTASPDDFLPRGVRVVRTPPSADVYFLAGFNWRILDEAGVDLTGKPVVNLIQGMRHCLTGDPRRRYLSRPALRICVSSAVYDGVRATGLANGPVVCIPNGIDLAYLSQFARAAKSERVFIAGAKNPNLAVALAQELSRHSMAVDLSCTLIAREEFLTRIGAATIAVMLPDPHEGFFLPGLEAMALDCAVVLPRCEGTSGYAIDGKTCLSPAYSVDAIVETVVSLRNDPSLVEHFRRAGQAISAEYSLERERSQFINALAAHIPIGG